MGLGAPKRRSKLSHDPNNTAWSRSTSNFGHRMLSQQGWEPGQYLGAENANHSDHYTAANASHIRILLREDNLGLGAKVGGNKAETFGLSLFSGVLGRLNGKTDVQVQKQQDALRDAELRQYQVGKYGLMNFVSGGLLVGDRIQEPGGQELEQRGRVGGADGVAEKKKGKKRKAVEDDSGEESARTKKQKSRKVGNGENEEAAEESRSSGELAGEVSRRKVKKDKRSAGKPETDDPAETAVVAKKKSEKRRKTTTQDDTAEPNILPDEKARLKQEKRARKENRRRRKEEKRLRKDAKHAVQATQEPKPVVQVNGGRHAVRHRYIQQKRMAGLDAQAMKEIFMIKAAS